MARAFRHTHTPRHVSGSADGRTSVLFSLKSVIFLSRLDGNVPTDMTGSDHPSFIQYREREGEREGKRGGRDEDGVRKTDILAGFQSRHFYANCDVSNLKSSSEMANSN